MQTNTGLFYIQVSQNFAINLVKEDPIVVSDKRVVVSDAGGPLGHPRVYINLVCFARILLCLLCIIPEVYDEIIIQMHWRN